MKHAIRSDVQSLSRHIPLKHIFDIQGLGCGVVLFHQRFAPGSYPANMCCWKSRESTPKVTAHEAAAGSMQNSIDADNTQAACSPSALHAIQNWHWAPSPQHAELAAAPLPLAALGAALASALPVAATLIAVAATSSASSEASNSPTIGHLSKPYTCIRIPPDQN